MARASSDPCLGEVPRVIYIKMALGENGMSSMTGSYAKILDTIAPSRWWNSAPSMVLREDT